VNSLFRHFFDDASLFPPAALAMSDAVAGHLRHQSAWYSEMSGPFVCAAGRLTELGGAITLAGVSEIDLALVVPDGAAGVEAAVDAVFADPRLRLRAVELPIAAADDPLQGTLAVIAALDRTPLAGASAFVEVPARQLTREVARCLAEHRYLAKVRTGGTSAEAFPDERTLASCVQALVSERLPYKCTAGLHHAVRHRDATTGFEHHGFLNVLLAVAAALDDPGREAVAALLAQSDSGLVAAAIRGLDADTGAAVRELFRSFGTCSTDDPLADLVTLGLVIQPAAG